MAEAKVFADGFFLKPKKENTPDWVIGKMSVKVEEAIAFLKANDKKGWVNLDLLSAQSGKPYVALDTFEPKPQGDKPKAAPVVQDSEDDDLPF